VLERLDKIDGVEASSANYTGSMIRIVVTAAANRKEVSEEVKKDLSAGNRKLAWLAGDELRAALEKEEWRNVKQIGQLSAIEFRTIALGWVKAFAEAEKLGDGVANELLKLTRTEWDRLAELADSEEGRQPPHRTDWRGRCKQNTTAVCQQADELLSASQRERLELLLTCEFERLIPEK
jgi:hypothetical protein